MASIAILSLNLSEQDYTSSQPSVISPNDTWAYFPQTDGAARAINADQGQWVRFPVQSRPANLSCLAISQQVGPYQILNIPSTPGGSTLINVPNNYAIIPINGEITLLLPESNIATPSIQPPSFPSTQPPSTQPPPIQPPPIQTPCPSNPGTTNGQIFVCYAVNPEARGQYSVQGKYVQQTPSFFQ